MKSHNCNRGVVVTLAVLCFCLTLIAGAPTVLAETIQCFNLDTNPGWTVQGQWQFGAPLGQGGASHGYPDPTSGATGVNVYGVNLAGDYDTAIGGPYYLTTGPLNLSGYENVKLSFQRWLNTDYQSYVYATIEVSKDGATWLEVWNNGGTTIADSQWTLLEYDISSVADNNSTVYIRWGHRVGSSGAFAFSGWNIDDICLTGEPMDDLTVTPGDGLSSSGYVGGPFAPSSKDYTLNNTGAADLDWTAEADVSWLDVTPDTGTLQPGQNIVVSVSINANANGLTVGNYGAAVTFTNQTSGIGQVRAVSLTVEELPPPPPQPYDPNPVDGATYVPIDILLSWNGAFETNQYYYPIVTDIPDGYIVRDGVLVEPVESLNETSQSAVTKSSLASFAPTDATLINFDDVTAPSGFVNTVRLTTQYAAQGVIFGGPGGNDGGAILNEGGGFGVTGHSPPNFLAFNSGATLSDGGIPRGPETLYFNPPVSYVEILAGSSYGGTVNIVAYNAGDEQVDSNSLIMSSYLQPITVSANGIVRVVISVNVSVFVLDNLAFVPDTASQALYDVYFDTANPPATLIHSGLTVPHCEPLPYPLAYETTYYWQVVASNRGGQTPGPVWSFTTVGPPGEIDVTDSIPPINDLNMPFDSVVINTSRTEHITITNTDPTYGLIVTDISLGGGYFEDFNDGLAQGWEPTVPSQWAVVSGEYRAMDTSQIYRMQSTYTGQTWADCAVQATLRRTGSMFNVARVVVRATDNFNCQNSTGSAYATGISGDGQYWVGKYVNGVFTFLQLWTSSPYLNTGETPNVVLLNIAGNAISVYLNGNLAWSGTDNDITAPGRIGLVPYTDSADPTIHYSDNVQVAEPLTGDVTLSAVQAWYNAHPYKGDATSEQSPLDMSPPTYPGGQDDSTPGRIGALSGSRGGFRIENLPALPAVIPPLGSVTFDVVFEPNLIGEYLSSAVIKSNDVDEPEVAVQLSGTGIPDYMEVTPDANFPFSGHPGGPFLPSYAYYYLKNLGPVQIDWMLTCPDWLNANITSGTIKPLETVKISVTPNALARSKPRGIYTGQLVFKNLTTTAEHDRNVSLNIYTDPKIWFTPGSVDANVCYGGSMDKILTIGNGGDGLLNFTLAGRQTGFTPVSMPVTIAGEPAIETQKDVAALAPPKHSFTALAGNKDFAEGQILVRFAPQPGRTWPGLAEKNSILANAGNGKLAAARVTKEYNIVRGLSLVKLPGDVAVKDVLVTLNNTPGVLYAEPDYKLKVMSAPQIVPNDPRFSELWGLNNTGQSGGTPDADIDAPEAWDIATGTNEIIVAVIDTGVDYTHPDLASNMWVNTAELNGITGVDDDGNGYIDDIYGYDFCNNDGDPMDDHYHGTHCAGTIGAIGNNGEGVAGVCWNVKIMALKFLDASGSGYTDDAIECVQYAVLMGAKLSSNSWGGGSYSQALKDAIDAAGNANQLFIAAAGNDYGNNNDINPAYPASYTSENIIAVMATDKYDSMSGFSNYGPTSVDIGAPGTDILSCQPGSSYQYLSGTSMATPHVSGAAALIWSVYPSMSYQEVKNILLQTVDEIPSLSGKCVSEGRLNLFNAVNEVGVFWMEFLPSSGSVGGGQTNNVTVRFHGDVPVGNYQGLITITSNDPYSRDINVPVTMTVRPIDYFTELFSSGDNDLDNHTLTLVPDNSVQFYTACLEDASSFPVDPAGGTVLTLNDDDYYEVQLQGSVVSLYGTSYDAFYIGSNGYITFVSGDTHYFERFSDHFALPRIAALFDDLNPAAGGTISYKQLADRIAVTFENVPEFSLNNDNTFQIEMFFDGRIRITWLRIDAQDGLVGLSAGNGLPDYFVERDISKYGPCICSNSPDLDHDGNVDWFDIVIFADHWLDIGCGPANLCCGGCDFKGNGSVNFDDFDYIADSWLSAP